MFRVHTSGYEERLMTLSASEPASSSSEGARKMARPRMIALCSSTVFPPRPCGFLGVTIYIHILYSKIRISHFYCYHFMFSLILVLLFCIVLYYCHHDIIIIIVVIMFQFGRREENGEAPHDRLVLVHRFPAQALRVSGCHHIYL